MGLSINQQAFLALTRIGLWEKDDQSFSDTAINIQKVYRLAQEQSIVGLLAAGIERISASKKFSKDILLIVGDTLQLEQRNIEMNKFVSSMLGLLRSNNINVVLVKGQGIAQCYKRPLWRACGDVDILTSVEDYSKCVQLLIPHTS